MGLADCSKCWDKLCTCGWEYRDWDIEKIEELKTTLENVLDYKHDNPDAKFSSLSYQDETEDDVKIMEHIKEANKKEKVPYGKQYFGQGTEGH